MAHVPLASLQNIAEDHKMLPMRLPQSSSQPSYLRFIFLAGLMFVTTLVPVCALAAPQLSGSPGNMVFGTVMVGQNESEEFALINNGQTSVTISSFSVSGSEFSVSGLSLPASLAAGESAIVTVTFSPTTPGWVYGGIIFKSNASNSTLNFPLAGAGGKFVRLLATPAAAAFGSVSVGSTKTVPIVIKNEMASSVLLTAFRGFGIGFSTSGLTLPMTLNPGQSATFDVNFAPAGAGASEGSLLIEGGSLSIPLVGTGVSASIGQLSVAPSGLNFGSVDVGSSTTQSATLTATGGAVTVSSASSSNAEFTISGASFPLNLNAGQTAELTILFSPTKSGAAAATLTVSSNASNTQATDSLAGTGVVPQYSVNLSWSASTSSVAGYNVYRGTTKGVYSRLNSSVDASTSFTDSTVLSGTTYYYAATSVSSSGQESGYSSPLQVSIP